MNVIRSAKIEGTDVLSPTGALLAVEDKIEYKDLFSEETKKAFNEGFEQGVNIGYDKACNELKILVNLLQTVIRKVLEQKERLLDQLKPEIIEFSINVCERVIRRELSHPEALVKLIYSLLEATRSSIKSDSVNIFISQEDFSKLEMHGSKALPGLKEMKGLHLSCDPTMQSGDVRIENKIGLLNYDIGRELADLQAKILQK